MGLFDSIFGGGGDTKKALGQASRNAAEVLRKNTKDARNDLGKGLSAASADYDQAYGLYTPLAKTANAGFQDYADALGVNGASGNARAVQQFQTGPGYQFALDQGLDALDRRAASRGMLGSGNTSTDTINYAQGQANQEYGDYLTRLGAYNTLAPTIAGAQSTVLGQDANANLNVRGQMAANEINVGNTLYAGKNALAAQKAQVGAQADSNLFGAITGGLGIGAKFLGLGL